MPVRTTPTTLSGGAGFNYEDRVAAYFLVQMLAGSQPLGAEFGIVTAVDFQVQDAGWLLEDLLVTFHDGTEHHSFAISIKSNRQVTRNGYPDHFVRAVWTQWLDTSSGCFDKERDLLGLATGRLADSVRAAWNDMLVEARDGDPERIAKRFSSKQVSAIKRNLFGSLECPPDLAGHTERNPIERASMLSRLRLLHLDFRDDPSSDEAEALRLCQDVLQSGSPSEAGELWKSLVTIGADSRPRGGSLSLRKLLRKLSPQFVLCDHPDYRHDWEIIARLSADSVESVRCDAGRCVSLLRAESAKQVEDKLKTDSILVLLGESGCGKSSLAKRLALSKSTYDRFVWLAGDSLDRSQLAQVERNLGLQHPLANVMDCIAASRALLVFDGIDRFSEQALANAARLMNDLHLADDKGAWHIILTSQSHTWPQVRRQLRSCGVSFQLLAQYVVDVPSAREVASIVSVFPSLNRFSLKRELKTVLRNLKVLDWVADCCIRTGTPDLRRWIGLTDLIDWIWESWVEQGDNRHARSSALKRIAELEGGLLTVGVPTAELQSHVETLPELENSGLVRVRNERIYFTHDLLGDWARLPE